MAKRSAPDRLIPLQFKNVDPQTLRDIETIYRHAAENAERLRIDRNTAVRQALKEGWTHARITQATGLTPERIGEIALERRNARQPEG